MKPDPGRRQSVPKDGPASHLRYPSWRVLRGRPRRAPWRAALLVAASLTLAIADAAAEGIAEGVVQITDMLVDWGHETPETPRTIDTIILHSTYYAAGDPYLVDGVLEQFKTYGVASHYLIARDGTVIRFVKDADVAYHAGKGTMPDGRTGINRFSIGIEINNTKTVGPNEAQYDALAKLVRHLQAKHPITHILGHSDIAPERKTDPWQFDRNELDARLEAK